MPDSRIEDLFLIWLGVHEDEGRHILPKELCKGAPELVQPLRARIEAWLRLQRELGLGGESQDADGPRLRPNPPPRPDPSIPRSLWDLADRHGYEILEKLGEGGQGSVYRAYDRLRRDMVALKALHSTDAVRLKYFRQEFLLSADLCHPNLVRLYELISDGEVWFFTMELVKGSHFLAFVRSGASDMVPAEAVAWSTPVPDVQAGGSGGTPFPGLSDAGVSRLRHALYQLARAIYNLHQAGMLHRDIKHNNVLVTLGGRVILLDYGLIIKPSQRSSVQSIEGTYAFMAPEQARGRASQASDWYSVGVMLYHALTGQLPFRGDVARVLLDKATKDPMPPRDLVPTVPEDLNALCVDLLQRAPEDRPSGEEVRSRLPPESPLPVEPEALGQDLTPEVFFVGRRASLDKLQEAYAAVRDGRAVQVLIDGSSGIGKSTLMHQFLSAIRKDGKAVVLAGRCHERVIASFEALHSLVDALTHFLRKPRVDLHVEGLLPRDLQPLLHLFPVLGGVEAVRSAPRGPEEATDQQELRRRAFAAFRELLQRLGDRWPLVLALDDLQWADLDSALLLSALLRPPHPPKLLLLGCYRTEDVVRSPSLQEFLKPDPRIDRRTVRLEALAANEAEDLAYQRLCQARVKDPDLSAAAIAQRSLGNPFILDQLVDDAQSGEGIVPYERVVAARVERLPEAGRRLLETLAVAARPLPIEEWFDAAETDGRSRRYLEDLLRTGRFIRSTAPPARVPEVEIYHDRIRETIRDGLAPADLRQHHERLVWALWNARPRGIPETDYEVLASHLEGAERYVEASRYLGKAAEVAARGLAFDRAIVLYRRALERTPADVVEQRPLHEQLGAALANAGRGADAAAAYLKAAERAEVGKNRDLRRRAAEQFLRSGHIKEGLRELDDVVREVGLRLPRTPRAARWLWLLRCAWVRLRGLRFRLRQEREIPPDQLQLIDLCRSAAVGLCMVDMIRSTDFQARNVLLALRAGEPGRIALALANQAMMCAFFGGAGRRYVGKLLRAAWALSHQTQNPLARANVALCRGGIALAEGRLLTAYRVCDRAEELLSGRCTGIAWELSTAQIFSLSTRTRLGDFLEFRRRLPHLFEDAQARGDLFAATHVRVRSYAFLVSLDQPDRALQELHQAMEEFRPRMEEWPQHGFYLQHYWFLVGQIEIELYRGNGPQAWELVNQHAPGLRHSLMLQADVLLVDWLYVRARGALAAAVASGPGNPQDARALLREAEGDARRLGRIKRPTAWGMGKLVRAGVAAAKGRTKVALELLTKAEQDFDAAGMKTLLAVARCRHAELSGSMTLYHETIASMIELGIQNPVAMLTMFAPGFESSSSVGW